MSPRRISAWGIALMVGLVFAACGGSGGSTPAGPSGGDPATTITITSAGVSPNTLQVAVGTQVTFVNNDSRVHDMASDPHPEHTDCQPINSVGQLQPGLRRQTANLITVRSCGFHDHNDPDNRNLKGTIVIR